MAKTFTMPDVQVGSILEYYYTNDLAEYLIFNSRWILSNELFTKNAKFSLQALHQQLHAHQRSLDLEPIAARNRPAGQARIDVVPLEASDIPAFQTEDYMPPGKRTEIARRFHL